MRGRQGESVGQLMQVTSSSFGKLACGAMIGLTSRRYSIGSKEWFGQISGTSIRPALSPTANSVVKKAATGHSVSFRSTPGTAVQNEQAGEIGSVPPQDAKSAPFRTAGAAGA